MPPGVGICFGDVSHIGIGLGDVSHIGIDVGDVSHIVIDVWDVGGLSHMGMYVWDLPISPGRDRYGGPTSVCRDIREAHSCRGYIRGAYLTRHI